MSDQKANVDSYIERLEKPAGVPPFIQREVAAVMRHQQAEIERLRAALERIAAGNWNKLTGKTISARKFAREALQDKDHD